RIEEQSLVSPDSCAVEFGETILTYRELNCRANRLAHWLRRQGAGPGRLVGVLMERSVEMVISLLGIMKSGGAWVPLDPESPDARLSTMLHDADPLAVLTQAHLHGRLSDSACRVLALDSEWAALAGEIDRNCGRTAGPDNLAYVIYTSGSTGK